MTPTLRRLFPDPTGPVDVVGAYRADRPARPNRPWITLTMVSSLDGSAAVGNTSGGLGNPTDREVLVTLRSMADVILVGAGTARAEGYGPPSKPDQRVGVFTNSGRIDADSSLFSSGRGFVIAPERAEVPGSVEVLRSGTERVDVAHAVSALAEVVDGVGHAQLEGGPTLAGTFAAADLIDELAITWSPRMVGGIGPRIATGGFAHDHRFTIAHLLHDDDGFVFTRWVRHRAATEH